jgi:hypothetical protein
MEEKQTTQWQEEQVQKDKQRSTKHTHKTKDRVTRTSVKTGVYSSALEVSHFSIYGSGLLLGYLQTFLSNNPSIIAN